MVYKQTIHILTLLLLIFALFLSGCAQAIQPVTTIENVPTPVTTDSVDAVDNPDIFTDPEFFLPALLQSLTAHDTGKLQQWMTNPFLESTWRFNQSEISPDEAIYFLYADQLGTENKLELVKDADLKTLMGGIDPLSIPGSESGVMYAYLVSGWGKDGRDEAILFITMEPADSLKWHGWMQIKGGFSGARIGGIQAYTDDTLGFSAFVPKDYEVSHPNDSEVMFLAPGEGHPSDDRASATIFIEPANGRTAEQVATAIAEDNKSVMGPGYTGGDITVMEIDGEPAYSVGGLTGQDINRRLYMVHNDQLYWMMFVPDTTLAPAYQQMEDLYAMIVNTFHFTR
jgi:hypothetical protein